MEKNLSLCLVGSLGFLWAFALSFLIRARSAQLRQRVAIHRTLRMLERVGRTKTVELLLSLPPWKELSLSLMGLPAVMVLDLGPESACALALVLALGICLLMMLLSSSWLGLVIGILLVLVGVPLWAASRKRARKAALVAEMPRVFRALALAMGAGETLAQAIDYVGSSEEGEAGKAFARAGLRMRCGISATETLDALAHELDAPGVGLLTCALLISQRTGSPLKSLFRSSASLVERQGEFERTLQVKTAQVRLSVRVVCLLPLVLLLLLSLLSGDYRSGLATTPGMVSVFVAALMDVVALVIIRHLLASVL